MTNPRYITRLFKGHPWYQTTEYSLMALLTLTIAIDWHWSVWVLMAMTLHTIVKCAVTHSVGNPAIGRPTRIALWLVIALYAMYAVSSSYSCDAAQAWSTTLITMLSMVLLAGIFLASDMRYLTLDHRSALIYLFAGALSLRFVVMGMRAAIRYRHGIGIDQLLDFHFDPLHHNYLAMYLIASVALLYTELTRHWKQPAWRSLRWVLVADMALLILYMAVMGSRSGLVILALLAVACMAHLMLVRRQWMATGIMVLGLAVLIGASYIALPKMYWRIIYLAEQLASGQRGDSRQVLWQCGYEVLQGHELIGHGCDGYWVKLHDSYVDHNFAEGFLHEQYNTHNQYLETALATGLVGLSLLLAIIFIPAINALRPHRRNLPLVLFTLVYAGCIAFEASLARQMGLIFIFWWYGLLQLEGRTNPSLG